MKISEVAFIGYPITDVERARKFYEGLLGLKESRNFNEGEHNWIEYDIGGTTLALSDSWPPSGESSPGASFEVDDFDIAIKEIKELGAEITMGPFESPVCWMAIIQDPDKHPVVIHKRKPDNVD